MRYLTGSRYFFSQYKDYKTTDFDYVEIVNDIDGFVKRVPIENGHVFQCKLMPIDRLIDIDVNGQSASRLCFYLVPEICKQFGFTIDMLPKLKPLLQRLRPKYKYLGVIYNAYISNNDFTLTDEQRLEAYKVYKANH